MKRCIPWLMALLLLMLAACAKPIRSSDDPSPIPAAESHALPSDNRQAAEAGEVFPDDDGWYTCVSGAIRYYDYASGQTLTLCAQPGCGHKDASCRAWLGAASSLAVYDGVIYATLTDDSTGTQLVRKDISTGRITVLDQRKNGENTFYSAKLGRLSDGAASVYLTCRTTEQQENGRVKVQEETTIFLYQLSDGVSRVLLSPEDSVSHLLLGFSGKYAAVVYTPPEQSILTPGEFAAQYGKDASYGRYVHQNTKRQLLLVDLTTGTQSIIADHDRDGYIMTADPNWVYGKDCIYQCGDELRLLDLDTGESRSLLTMDKIINYWLIDNKAFLIVDNNVEMIVWYAELEGGKAVKLENATDEHGMIMSVSQEGGSFFRALGSNGSCVISKADFYAGRYDSATAAG